MSCDHEAQVVYNDLLRKFPNNVVKPVITAPWKAFHHLCLWPFDPVSYSSTCNHWPWILKTSTAYHTEASDVTSSLSYSWGLFLYVLQILSVIFSGSSSLISLFKAVLHHLSSLPTPPRTSSHSLCPGSVFLTGT